MKKVISFLLITFFTLISISGCSLRTDAAVHVFYYTYSDTYISTVRSALDNALSAAGISYQDHDSANSQATQTEQIQTAITKGAKLLVVNIVTTGSDDAAKKLTELAKSADIPIIFFNREVSADVVNDYEKCAFIGTDSAEAGSLQGDMIGNYVTENFKSVDLNSDGKISYVMFMGEKGNVEAISRTKYSVINANAKLNAAGYPSLSFYDAANTDKYLLDREGKWSAQAANDYMSTILSSYSIANGNMVELIICNNDGMAEGAISALNAAGYNTGPDSLATIPVFGVDATSAACELIRNGKMTGTVKQDGLAMANAITQAVQNVFENKDAFENMTEYATDDDAAKLRIPYSIYLGD